MLNSPDSDLPLHVRQQIAKNEALREQARPFRSGDADLRKPDVLLEDTVFTRGLKFGRVLETPEERWRQSASSLNLRPEECKVLHFPKR